MYITTEVRINNAHCIQQAVISFIVISLGDDIMKIGSNSRPNVRKHAKKAADKYLPNGASSFKTAERWFQNYLMFGETLFETSKCKKSMLEGKDRRIWLQSDTDALKVIVDSNPGYYLDEIIYRLKQATDTRWSPSSVWKKIRQELRYSLQRVAERALEQDQLERLEYQETLKLAVYDQPELLLYIDESQKGKNESRRRRWWSPRGRTPTRVTMFNWEPSKQYTLIAACDINGFIPQACDLILRGNSLQEEIDNPLIGTVGTERVELWVEQFLVPVLGNYSKGEPRSVVVLDNATVHHSPKIRQLILSAGAVIIYLAPYSPDLNPVELMFGMYKMRLKRLERGADWHTNHLMALASVTPAHARSFFRHCGVPGCRRFGTTAEEEEARDHNQSLLEQAVAVTAAVAAVFAVKKRRMK